MAGTARTSPLEGKLSTDRAGGTVLLYKFHELGQEDLLGPIGKSERVPDG